MTMRPLLRRFRRNEKGLAALEFALLAPLFALAAIGGVDYALRFNAQSSLDDALRLAVEGAIRLGDNAEGIAEFLNQNGYETSVASFGSEAAPFPEGMDAAPSGTATELSLRVQETEACFETGAMIVGERGSTACTQPERWLRLSASYPLQTLTSGLVRYGSQIDVKVR